MTGKREAVAVGVAGAGVQVEERVIRRGNQGGALSWRDTDFGARAEGLLGTPASFLLAPETKGRPAVFMMTASSAKTEQ